MLETYPKQVKLVYKNFPLRNHKFARPAAIAALAAGQQGKFWPFHDKLYENYNRLSDQKIREIAAEVGLDMARYEKGLQDQSIRAQISRDIRDAREAGVGGTPTVFVNGRLIRNKTKEGLKEAVEKELARLKK